MEAGSLFEDRYRIVGQLGTGGQSNVFRADDEETGRRVAIKLLHTDGDGVRFIREGRVVSRLESPHTVRLIEFDRAASGQFYLVFEFVAGENLRELAVREAPLPWSRVARYARGMLIALAEAHALGIVHRDIKPSNIMVGAGDEVKVLDFGVARLDEGDDENAQGLTAPGEVLGTPRYVSPEALSGATVTPATDVYGVGLVAWELLAGRPANDARNSADIVLRHLDPTPFRLPNDIELPDEARRWVTSLVNKNVQRRPKDAAEALAALDEFQSAPAPVVTVNTEDDPDDSYESSMDDLQTRVLGADDSESYDEPPPRRIAVKDADPTPEPDQTDPEPWLPPTDEVAVTDEVPVKYEIETTEEVPVTEETPARPDLPDDHTMPDPWVPDELAQTDQMAVEDLADYVAPPPPQMASKGLPSDVRPAAPQGPHPRPRPEAKKESSAGVLVGGIILLLVLLFAAAYLAVT